MTDSKRNTEGTPETDWKPKTKEEDDEDLRVHLLRLREQKVEQKLKQLEEESIETEFMLWKLQKNKSSIKDENQSRKDKQFGDNGANFNLPGGTGVLSPHSLKRRRSSSPVGHKDRRPPLKRPFRKQNRY